MGVYCCSTVLSYVTVGMHACRCPPAYQAMYIFGTAVLGVLIDASPRRQAHNRCCFRRSSCFAVVSRLFSLFYGRPDASSCGATHYRARCSGGCHPAYAAPAPPLWISCSHILPAPPHQPTQQHALPSDSGRDVDTQAANTTTVRPCSAKIWAVTPKSEPSKPGSVALSHAVGWFDLVISVPSSFDVGVMLTRFPSALRAHSQSALSLCSGVSLCPLRCHAQLTGPCMTHPRCCGLAPPSGTDRSGDDAEDAAQVIDMLTDARTP